MRRGLPTKQATAVLSDTAQLAGVRRCVRTAAAGVLGAERLDDVELCVSELATNAMLYGSGECLYLSHDVIDDSFVVTVSNSSTVLPQLMVTELRGDQPDGRGLRIVRALADGVAVSSEHGTVSVSCRFDP